MTTTTDHKLLLELLVEGKADAEIGRILGVSRQRVKQVRAATGTPPALKADGAFLAFEVTIVNPLAGFPYCGTCLGAITTGRASECEACYLNRRYHTNARARRAQRVASARWRASCPDKVAESAARARKRYRERKAGQVDTAYIELQRRKRLRGLKGGTP